ncbi:hypothetical protein ABKV19_002750 [Rosa sericea]
MSLAIIVVIVTWIGCKAIIKWIWTLVKRLFSYMVGESQDNQVLDDMDASESLSSEWKYDVFLSFRGPDTRRSITSDLYDRLQKRGIKTFMDDPDLQVGDGISSTLIAAIEKSRFAIVVLSENYAHSAWCLDELAKICECMEESNRIFPLFYNVEPSDIRHRKGSFGEAFNKHESSGRHTLQKVQRWNDALNKVASFSGWHTKNYKTDRELAEIIEDFVFRKVQPIDVELTLSTGDFEEFEATRKAMDEVMKALKNDEVTAVGVYGMGGVGKTTMVKHVAAQSCKKGTFHHVIMAVVSQTTNFERIQGTLADMLGVKLEKETETGRAARLRMEIMRKEKLLIILDDVWKRIELSTIGIPSYEELQKRNSKVVFTTRKGNVCHAMKCQEKITLNILSEEDSWTLFATNARRSFQSNARRSFELTEFERVARKVAGECRGLPIALIAVARALGDKDQAEWQKAARRLEKSQSATVEDEHYVFECIKFSYDYLKDEDHKLCFLLCCLYPEDYDIRLENLFRYAIGTGLFRDETIEESRETADSVVKYLKDSSLLLDSEKKGCVKMHDVIRDTALNIANSKDGHRFLVKAGCRLRDWPCGSHQGYSAISLMSNEIWKLPKEELVCPNLQILLLQKNEYLNEIPEIFIQSANELKVLDLSKTSIYVLPQSFSHLTNLQALYLDFCHEMIDISSVGKLKKLEILSMREYPLKELSREIGNLTNLRMLDVSGCMGRGIVTIPSKVISKLNRLEELYMLYCGFKDWGCEVEGQGEETNIGFDELAGLSYLKILQVCISDAKYIPKNVKVKPNWVYFDIRFGDCRSAYKDYRRHDHNSRSLVLHSTIIRTLPDWFVKAVTTKTQKLEYGNCKGINDILMEYDYGRLHELKHLTIRYFSFSFVSYNESLEALMNTTRQIQKAPVFEKLEELHLTCLIELKELCVGELPPGSLINLKEFKVYGCHKLGNVSNFLKRLPNLEKLYLNILPKLEYVFGCEGFEPEQSEVREMVLMNLNALRSICNGPSPCSIFQSLNSLVIDHCKLLQSLFASDVAQCLVHLEDLFLEHCPLLERVIETVNNEKTVLRKLKNLVLTELPKLYGASATVDIKCPSLEHLIVVNCPQFSFSCPFSLFYNSQFSFSIPASNYFGSTNLVKLNDPQLYYFLHDSRFTEAANPIDTLEALLDRDFQNSQMDCNSYSWNL